MGKLSFSQQFAILRVARIVKILSLVLLFPAAIAESIWRLPLFSLFLPLGILFLISGGYWVWARCPRCSEPALYFRDGRDHGHRWNTPLSVFWWNLTCIHCGWSMSEGTPLTRADYLGPTALPIYVRTKGLLKAIGWGLVCILIAIPASGQGFWNLSIRTHVILACLEFFLLIGVYEFFVGVPFRNLLNNFRCPPSLKKWSFAIVTAGLITVTPFCSWLLLRWIGEVIK